MTLHSIHYDSTRLIRIRITGSDSADACTCGGYLCSTLSCSILSYVLPVLQWIKISPTTRLALSEFQASCYSHHKSQSALSETNWLLGASGCNLTLNPYLVIQMGHHHEHPLAGPWNYVPTTEARPRRSHLETPRNYTLTRTNIHKSAIREY